MQITTIKGIGKEICLSTFERTEIKVMIDNVGKDFCFIKKAFFSGIYNAEIVSCKCLKLINELKRNEFLVNKYHCLFMEDFCRLKTNIEKFSDDDNLILMEIAKLNFNP